MNPVGELSLRVNFVFVDWGDRSLSLPELTLNSVLFVVVEQSYFC